jgi:hypothetical protein
VESDMLRLLHGPNGPVYKDNQFHTFIMDDFGDIVEVKGHIKDLATEFLLSAFIFNQGDIGW